jgi:hypothetical protein
LLKLFICPRPLAIRDRGIGSVDRVRPVDGNWIGGYASRQDGRESRERRGQGYAHNYMKCPHGFLQYFRWIIQIFVKSSDINNRI